MKKIFTIILVGTAAVLASVSCNKEEVKEASKDGTVRFYANEIKTKTEFGTPDGTTYPTLWTGKEDVYISLNMANSVKASVTPTGSKKTADFTTASDITDDGSGIYVFYAVSPNQVSKINTTYNSWNLEIPANQSPTATSVDEAAQVLFAKESTGSTFPASVGLNFKHVTAYGKLSFTNLALDPGETVTSVVIEAPVNWVGRWYYYVEDHDTYKAGDIAPSSASDILTITTDKTSDIWFACAPVDLQTKTIDVTVSTTKGTFSKSVTFPSGKGNFEAGKIGGFTVDMSGVVRAGGVVYTLVDDVADLTLGSEVIIVNTAQSKAAGTLGSNTFLAAQNVTISSDQVQDPSSSVEVFTIANGNIAGTYAFKVGSKEGNYLYHNGGTSIGTKTTLGDAGSWSIEIDGSANAIIRNMSDVTRYLLSNTASAYRISTYMPGTNYENVSIFKKNGTGSGAITAKEPSNIVVTDATTSYLVGNPYSFDGTVTLNYSDKTSKVLSSSEYSVNSSSVNMSVADTYTITVSLVADPSIYTTYDITVESSLKTLVYTFETVKNSSNTAYASMFDVTINGVAWKAPGNQNFDGYWRIGGKSLTNTDRVIYSVGSFTSDVDEIVINTNGINNTNLTVNSISVSVYASSSDAAYGTSPIATFTTTDTFTFSVSTAKSLTFKKSGTTDCSGKYYRIVFNVSNSTTSNYGIDLQKILFYNN